MISVADAINTDIFRNCTIIAGQNGLDRPIRWVTILEVLDEISLLQEGDLLVTTAFGLENDTVLLKELVPRLAELRLAGLAIQTGYYLNRIPPAIIEQCNQFALPLILIPKYLSFGDITRSLLKRIINRQMELLEYAQRINSRFMQIVLANQGFPKIADVLNNLVSHPVRIFDKDFRLIVSVGLDAECIDEKKTDDEFKNLRLLKLLPSIDNNASPIAIIPAVPGSAVPRQAIVPLAASKQIHGYLSVLLPPHRNLSDMDASAITAAATVSTLELLKQVTVIETENRLQGDFLDELINGSYRSIDTLNRRASYLGYDLARSFVILIADVDDFYTIASRKPEDQVQQLKSKLASLIRQQLYGYRTMIAQKSDKFIILLQLDSGEYVAEVRHITGPLAEKVETETAMRISIGVGLCYQELIRLPDSLKEAEKALFIGKKLEKNIRVYFYENLGLHRLFLHSGDQEELTKFYNGAMKKLFDYDHVHHTELVSTLQAFINNNGEIKATAKKIFIHRHTLKYRLTRIQEISGLNPLDCQDRLQLQLGIIISHMLACSTSV